MAMASAERKCEQCGRELKGRAGQRFCTDQCRATHHNLKKLENQGEQLIRKVNTVLRQNRSVLKPASPQGKTTVNRLVLERAGFDFRYFTHVYRTQKGSTYHFCYDYSYLLLPEEKVLIVNHQAYMVQP
jgi:hypothetical protein